ncbi:MAG: hypothetical protein ACRBFS_10635 [Aureispira sp.]
MIIDFIIGLTLVNALPHFVLGLWKGRMFSIFGFGNTQNILYGILNFIIAISLLLYKYGLEGLTQNYMFLGGAFVIISYFFVGKYCYTQFHEKYHKETK